MEGIGENTNIACLIHAAFTVYSFLLLSGLRMILATKSRRRHKEGNISCFYCSLWLNKNHALKDFVSTEVRVRKDDVSGR